MSIVYNLSGFQLLDANSYSITPQVSAPLNLTIGDKKILELNFTRQELPGIGYKLLLDSEIIYFNPALYIGAGVSFTPSNSVPSVNYQFELGKAIVSGTLLETPMTYNGDATKQNDTATIAFAGGVLTIRLEFFVTADISDFLKAGILNNSNRFIYEEISQSAISVYNSSKDIGVYLVSNANEIPGGLYFETGTNLIVRRDGLSWNALSLTIVIASADNPVFNNTYTVSSIAGNVATVSTPVPLTAFSGAIATDPGGTYILYKGAPVLSQFFLNENIEAAALFYDDAGNTMTASSLEIQRSAIIQTELSSVESSDLTFKITHTTAPTKSIVFIQNRQSVTNAAPFYNDSVDSVNLSASIVNTGGNNYETYYTMPAAAIGGDYFFLIVWYDEPNDLINSFGFELDVTQEQAETAFPDIQRKLDDILNEYGDYIKAPFNERIKSSMFLDKSTYNARSLNGDFDDNFTRWELQVLQDGFEVQNFVSETIAGDTAFVITDSPTNYNIEYLFRLEKAWIGTQIVLQWIFYFDNGLSSDSVGLQQKIDVHNELKNIVQTDILEATGTFTIANFCDDLNQIAIARTTSTAGNYKQMAVLVLPTIQEEESFVGSGQVPQSFAANLLDVDEDFVLNIADAKIDIEDIKPDAIVILSKEVTEDVQIGAAVNLKLILQ